MDSFWVIVLFILFAIFSDKKGKKKPVPKRRIPDFPQRPLPDIGERLREKLKIPELRGAPPIPEIQTSQTVQDKDAILAEQERYQEMLHRKKMQQLEQESQQATIQREERQQAPQPQLTLNNMQQAVIWSEILAKPKAYRRRR